MSGRPPSHQRRVGGCGKTNGLAQLASELENITGLHIDHAVAIDMAGFQDVIDQLGGYQICTNYPLRDSKSGLDIAGGCTQADGKTTWSGSGRPPSNPSMDRGSPCPAFGSDTKRP